MEQGLVKRARSKGKLEELIAKIMHTFVLRAAGLMNPIVIFPGLMRDAMITDTARIRCFDDRHGHAD